MECVACSKGAGIVGLMKTATAFDMHMYACVCACAYENTCKNAHTERERGWGKRERVGKEGGWGLAGGE